ncbi:MULTISPECIES: helix-turn-helix domain-containing protein, partial [unclassified Aeromonas]|uniref:helix-turn-helix domain-containing protein n=1 Tax=unclassified Aeromonas TaxID=257493 RepID=UPI0022E8D978
MQTPIITQREIVRLLEQRQLSNRAIARQLSISHNTVAVIRSRLQVTGLSHSELGKVRTSIPRTKNENFSHLISMGYQ